MKLPAALATLTFLSLFAADAPAAQTLVAWDGVGAVVEFTGPPEPLTCGFPTGPITSVFPNVAVGCPAVFPIGPPVPGMPGGVAYDSTADTVFVSDGGLIEIYTSGGVFLDSFFSPLPVFGLGVDAAAGLLWSTDGGALAYAMFIPFLPACGGPTPLAVPPFPTPFPAAPLSGIDWDPLSGSLWATDLAGMVHNFLPGGAPGPIAPLPFPVAPGPCWAGPPGLLRVACDKGSPFGPGHLYLSDGFVVSSILPGGAPAPPTFAFPGPGGAPCFPTAVPSVGIAYAAHAIGYGAGLDPDGLAAPVMAATGSTASPSPTFTFTLASAVPGGVGLLVMNGGVGCPALPLFGVPVYVSPLLPLITFPPVAVSAVGTAALPAPLPAGLPPGLTLFAQWFVVKPAGPSLLQASNGLSFRTALP